MLKRISTLLISFLILITPVYAADFNYTLTSSELTVSSSVTLTIDGTESGLTGRFNLTISNSNIATLSKSSIWIENNRDSVTITGKNPGTVTLTILPAEGMSDGSANEVTINPKVITLTVKEKPVVSDNPGTNNNQNVIPAKPKSNNNYLTDLSVEGLKLNSEFDKEIFEYTVTAEAKTEKIVINARVADSKSKVEGTGEKEVKTGINTFEITVTAENGNTRKYTLKVDVLELLPTIIKINKEEYSIIKNKEDLPKISEYYEYKEIEIDGEKIPSYYNETLKYTLVALKDKNSKINYYIYKLGKYTLYKEYTFNGTTLQIIDRDLPKTYKKATFKYNGDIINSYQEIKEGLIKKTYALDSSDVIGNQFYLFYAKNIETGEDNIYQYDALEKTVQRYNTELLNMYKNNNETYYTYILIQLLLLAILLVFISLLLIRNSKLKNNIKKEYKKKNKSQE